MKYKTYKILIVFISTLHFASSFSKSSLTFVIDDTGSMGDDIDQVIEDANAIYDTVLAHNTSQIENFVIVTFNDPDTNLRVKTKSRVDFKTALRNIRVDGGGDCPEMSMLGIRRGLENSLDKSELYVFTDASAKDYLKGDEVIALAQSKQCRITFILTGQCSGREKPDHKVYYTTAKSTSGEVFHLKKGEVNKVLKYVEENIKARREPILTKEFPPGKHTVPVTIDSGHKDVLFSVSGLNPDLKIKKNGKEIDSSDIMTTKESKIVKPKTLTPGPYTTDVKSDSNSTLVVTGVSDFKFEHGFSTFIPKNIESTSKQPIPDQISFMSIVLSEGSPDLISAEIIDNTDSSNVIKTIPLHKKDKDSNLYITDPFIPPTDVFKIAVNGIDRKTKSPIRRIGAIPIVPQKPTLAKPKIDKVDTTMNVVEGSNVEIPCRIIEGYKPSISWTFKAENSDESSVFAITDNIVKLSEVDISQSGWYECVAENTAGQDSHKVKLHVEKYPDFVGDTNREIEVSYGSSITVLCQASGDPPPIIIWEDENRNKLSDATSSGDSKDVFVNKLTLRNITKDSIYFCDAENIHGLIEDKTIVNVKRHFIIIERIPQVKPIKIYTKDSLQCLVDSEPPATVTWYHNDTEISSKNKYNIQLSGDGMKITFKNMSQENVGNYKCKIHNAFEEKTFMAKVILNVPPSILKEKSVLYKKEGSSLKINCNIERGEPAPTISWYFKAFGEKDFTNLSDEVVKISNIKKEDGGKYKCVAKNIAGVDEYYVDLMIEYPPEIRQVSDPISTKEGDRVILSCKYSGYPPPRVYWTKSGSRLTGGKYRTHLDNSLGFVANVTDTGVYTCVAENDLGVARKDVEVAINEPPTIEVPDRTTLKVIEGTSMIMPCVAHGSPRPNVLWTHRSEDPSKPSMFIEKDTRTGAGIIRRAVLNHAGYYTCEASNSVGKYVLTYTLIVNAKARIISNKTAYFHPVSGDVALNIPCKPYGNPKPEVLWSKDGVNIAAGTEWYDIDSDGTLTIKNIDEEANGGYTCHVKNVLGRDVYYLNVKVYPYPVDGRSNKTIAVEKGKDVKLPCDIPHTKADSLRWFKNGREISRSELSFTNVEESKSGIYFCRVSNDILSVSAVVNLNVGAPPRFIRMDYTKSFPLSDGYAVFNCEVDDKDSKILWYHKDEKISDVNFIYFLELRTDDESVIGNYQCKVFNKFGTITRDFHIKGQECIISMNDSKYQPLILTPDSNWLNIKIKNNTIKIPSNYEFKLVCPSNADNNNAFKNFYGKKEITVKCEYDEYLQVSGEDYPYTFSEFLCTEPLASMSLRTGTRCSAANTELIKIGYQTPSKFLDIYKVCYDKDKHVPVYTEAKISPTDVVLKPIITDFVKDRSLTFNPEEMYNCEMQIREISSVLGEWFHADDRCCFDKKLLISPTFMPYGPPQIAAYNYFNVAPSWSTCNGMRNSVELENRLKIMVNELGTDVNLWSGTHDTLRLSDKIEITDRSGHGVQVPLYFWKVIQDPSTERSIAIVHVNVPDLSKENSISFVRCTDVCRRVSWLNTYRNWLDTTIGFTYCCSIDDFERSFGYPKAMFQANGAILS